MICSACGATSADGSAFCRSCGRPIVGFTIGQSVAGSPGGEVVSTTLTAVSSNQMYAGFWLRFVAAIIDGIILGIPLGVIAFLMIASALPELMHTRDPVTIMISILPRLILMMIVYLLASWLYWALLESSTWQATLGKKALGLCVTDLAGNRPAFGKATGRFFAGRGISFIPSIGGLYFLIDCIMAGFTEKKQALHDMIAGCLVLRKA